MEGHSTSGSGGGVGSKDCPLEQVAVHREQELPESQCGFRQGRGCTDMIFVVRQLVEKALEHQMKQYLIFVDLHKAYDSVLSEAMWVALRKLGVPDLLVDIIRSFHTGMEARIRVDGEYVAGGDRSKQCSEARVYDGSHSVQLVLLVWWLRSGQKQCRMWRMWGWSCFTS